MELYIEVGDVKFSMIIFFINLVENWELHNFEDKSIILGYKSSCMIIELVPFHEVCIELTCCKSLGYVITDLVHYHEVSMHIFTNFALFLASTVIYVKRGFIMLFDVPTCYSMCVANCLPSNYVQKEIVSQLCYV